MIERYSWLEVNHFPEGAQGLLKADLIVDADSGAFSIEAHFVGEKPEYEMFAQIRARIANPIFLEYYILKAVEVYAFCIGFEVCRTLRPIVQRAYYRSTKEKPDISLADRTRDVIARLRKADLDAVAKTLRAAGLPCLKDVGESLIP
jgi:hypothetical protein